VTPRAGGGLCVTVRLPVAAPHGGPRQQRRDHEQDGQRDGVTRARRRSRVGVVDVEPAASANVARAWSEPS
jgi:hypothetical protein